MAPRGPGEALAFSHYDRRRYPTLDVTAGYALWSRAYAGEDRFDLDLLACSEVLGARVSGAAVLDLGCGTGRLVPFHSDCEGLACEARAPQGRATKQGWTPCEET